MIWPFSKKRPAENAKASMPEKLIFKNGAAFFEYQCKYGHNEIRPNHGIIALVLDATEELGTDVAVKIQSDGRQRAILKVASDDGGFILGAGTPSDTGDRLKPDDVVIWVPLEHSQYFYDEMDVRTGWIGVIVAKVAPEIDTATGGCDIICRYA